MVFFYSVLHFVLQISIRVTSRYALYKSFLTGEPYFRWNLKPCYFCTILLQNRK